MSIKILCWDTETSPNTVYTWGLWNQNIGLNQIIETSRLLCVCAKWVDSGEVFDIPEWNFSNRKAFLTVVWRVLDEADAVVSYNGKGFDTKVLLREFVMHDLPPPSPYHEIDLYQVVKKNFKFASNKLDHVSSELGLGSKIKHEGFEMWIKVMNGDLEARKKMLEYCAQDTALLEPLYKKLLPWIKNHPNTALYENNLSDPTCPNCGGTDLVSRGYAYTRTMKYKRVRCNTCNTWSQHRLSDLSKEDRECVLKTC